MEKAKTSEQESDGNGIQNGTGKPEFRGAFELGEEAAVVGHLGEASI